MQSICCRVRLLFGGLLIGSGTMAQNANDGPFEAALIKHLLDAFGAFTLETGFEGMLKKIYCVRTMRSELYTVFVRVKKLYSEKRLVHHFVVMARSSLSSLCEAFTTYGGM